MLLPGVYGLSNRQLDTPWPKLLRTRERFERELASDHPQPEALMRMLSDRTMAADDALPDTGIGLEWERLLSAPFIVSDGYGTRCSTVVLIRNDGRVTVEERSHATDGSATIRVRMAYESEAPR